MFLLLKMFPRHNRIGTTKLGSTSASKIYQVISSLLITLRYLQTPEALLVMFAFMLLGPSMDLIVFDAYSKLC